MKASGKLKAHGSRHGEGQSTIKSGRILKKQRAKQPSKALPSHIGKFLDDSLEVSFHDTFDKIKNGPMANMVTFKDRINTTTNMSSESKSVSNRDDASKSNIHVMMTRSKSRNLTKSADTSSALRHKIFDEPTPSCDKLDSLIIEVVKKNKSESYSFIIPHKKKGQSAEVPLNFSSERVGNTTIGLLCGEPIYYSTPISILGDKTLPNKQQERVKLNDSKCLSQCTPSKEFLIKKRRVILCNEFKNFSISLQEKSDISMQHRSEDKSKSSIRKTPELECGDSLSQQLSLQYPQSDLKCDNSAAKVLLSDCPKSEISIKNTSEMECCNYISQQHLSAYIQLTNELKCTDSVSKDNYLRCINSEVSVRITPVKKYVDSLNQQQILLQHVLEYDESAVFIKTSEQESKDSVSKEQLSDSVSQQHISKYAQSEISFKTTELECTDCVSKDNHLRCSDSEAFGRITPGKEYVGSVNQQQILQQHVLEDDQSVVSIKTSEQESEDSITKELFSDSAQSLPAFKIISDIEYCDSISPQHVPKYAKSETSLKTSELECADSVPKDCFSRYSQPEISIRLSPEKECRDSFQQQQSFQRVSEHHQSEISFKPRESKSDGDSMLEESFSDVQSEAPIKSLSGMECWNNVSPSHISDTSSKSTILECYNSVFEDFDSRCIHSKTSLRIVPEKEYGDSSQQQVFQQHFSEPAELETKTSESESKDLFSESTQSETSIKSTEMEYVDSIAKDHQSSCNRLEAPVTIFPETECGDSTSQQHISEYVQLENSIKVSPTIVYRGAIPRQCPEIMGNTPTNSEMVDLDAEPRSHREPHHFVLRESTVINLTEDVNEEGKQTIIHLSRRMSRPGKSWRRWLHKVSPGEERTSFKRRSRRSSMRIVPLSFHRPIKIEEGKELENISEMFSNISLKEQGNVPMENPLLARKIVLLKCGQQQPEYFESLYNDRTLTNCKKIGEGTYGEVFCFEWSSGEICVMKIIPIEGEELVNGEKQKKFCEILSEITIATALSNLRKNCMNFTDTFNEVYRVRCVQGVYPQILTRHWEEFNQRIGSENDHPCMFRNDQLYIILELRNGGTSFEVYKFKSPVQGYYVFQQIAFALAVAENALKFEHRDLHWGNILLGKENPNGVVRFRLNGMDCYVPSKGVRATIIDFTLSRVESDDMIIFNDLTEDYELFEGDGSVDYQFEIYRLMKEKNGNNWQEFQPYTNLLWLHYLLDKTIHKLKYRRNTARVYIGYINKLKALKDEVLTYDCVTNFVMRKFISNVNSQENSITPST